MKARLRSIQVGVGVAVAALAAAFTPAVAATAAPTEPWAPTATHAAPLAGSTDLGAAPASASVPVSVQLNGRDRSGLDALVAAQRDPSSDVYHQYLTPAAFAEQFGATSADVDAVTAYLRSQGLTDITVAANHLTITAQTTAAGAERAFHTSLRRFRSRGRTAIVNTAPALVPRSLAGVVGSVLGLDGRTSAVPDTARPGAAFVGYTSAQLAQAYDASSLPQATSITMAIMAEGNLSPVVTDLRSAESDFSEPQVPVTIVGAPSGSSDTSSQDEWDLDSQASSGMAGNVNRLYLYDAPSLDDGAVATEIAYFASQDVAQLGSASFGICDDQSAADGSASAINASLEEAAAQGQSFFASSGDDGSSCSDTSATGGPTQTEFPASSPYAVGVGGTTLSTNANGTYAGETAWDDSGGGISVTQALPAYQQRAVQSADAGATGRGVPDIAMDGDPDTGLIVIDGGLPTTIGGTSLSSPLAMGAWARIDDAHGGSLGPAGPDLYTIYGDANTGSSPGATPGLHDVTSGSNGVYSATVGYDFVTGLGTIDAAALSAELTAVNPSGDATYYGSEGGKPLNKPIVGIAADDATGGYWLVASDGGVFPFNAPFYGSTGSERLNAPVVGIAATADDLGYYLVASDGGIFAFGDATRHFFGSEGNKHLNKPVVGMATDPQTNGYWLVAADGGIFAFNVPFYGSTGSERLNKPVVGMAPTADDRGYDLVAADGGIFAFGDATQHFYGSAGSYGLTSPVVGMATDNATGGYWIVAADGGVYAFGAPNHGSMAGKPLNKPVVGMAATADSGGYWLTAADGGIFCF